MARQGIRGILILEDGERFEGMLFGAPVSASSIRSASRDRGYGGLVLDIKYTDVKATLATPATPRCHKIAAQAARLI